MAVITPGTTTPSWMSVGGTSLSTPQWAGLVATAHPLRATGGKAALGDPRKALTWFVNEAATHCGGVQAGQFVTTGTCVIPYAIAPGDRIGVDYGALGTIEAEIA